MGTSIQNVRRKKQQVSISTQQEEGNPNSFLFYTDNAASGRISGFELENTLNISDELEIIFSLGYLDTYVNKFKYQIDNNSIKIGGWSCKAYKLVLIDLSNINDVFESLKASAVDGIIGADILKTGNAIIDYEKKYLYLKY